MRGWLRSLILILLTAGSSVAAILADRLLPGGNRAERVMGWWGRAFVRLGGWTFRVEGMENLPSVGAVLVANHQSIVDIPMLLSAFPRPVRFLAKRELGEIPLFGKAMAAAGNLFIDRNDPRDAVRMLRDAGARLRDGWLVVVFPAAGTGRSGSSGRGPSTSRRSPGRSSSRSTWTAGTGRSPRGAFAFGPPNSSSAFFPRFHRVKGRGDRKSGSPSQCGRG
jgi:1-acyl-sn-glycerol-3-phosphate acyltransferase